MVSHPELIFVFLVLSLSVGVITNYLITRYAPDLPYTVVLFGIGILLSVSQYNHKKDIFLESFAIWESMEPHFILYAFLPALLFGDSMYLNYHNMVDALSPALILAGPGALFGTFALAFVVKNTLIYDWDWNLCVLFGAILCATDPVGKDCRTVILSFVLYIT